MFCSWDRGQNNKRSLTFYTGLKFSSWSNFNENWLKLIGLTWRFRKCIVSYTLHVTIFGQRRGQSSKFIRNTNVGIAKLNRTLESKWRSNNRITFADHTSTFVNEYDGYIYSDLYYDRVHLNRLGKLVVNLRRAIDFVSPFPTSIIINQIVEYVHLK